MSGMFFYVGDNSGVIRVKCIGFLNKGLGIVGDLAVFSVKSISVKRSLSIGMVVRGLIVRTRKLIFRNVGHYVISNANVVVLCKVGEIIDDLEPFGTRVLSFLFFEVKLHGYLRVVAIARNLV